MKISVISCSLNPQSRSYVLARTAVSCLGEAGAETDLHDLRNHDLEFCGIPSARESISEFKIAIEQSVAILLAVPIYNFDVNAAAKNLIELTGRSWTNKVVGFMCAAGGNASYMSVMGIANSLILDFRCLIIPGFVYAVSDDFANDRTDRMEVGSDEIRQRLSGLAHVTVELARSAGPLLGRLPQ